MCKHAEEKNFLTKKSNWTINIAFLTGSPDNENESWFHHVSSWPNMKVGNALFMATTEGYMSHDDICATAIFSILDDDVAISPADQLYAEMEMYRILLNKLMSLRDLEDLNDC